jgi:hypothetical protein
MQPIELPPDVFVAVSDTLVATPSVTEEGVRVSVQPPDAADARPALSAEHNKSGATISRTVDVRRGRNIAS